MKKDYKQITWDKTLFKISFILLISYIFLCLLCIITKQTIDVIVILLLILLIILYFIIYLHRFNIKIYKDKIIIQNIFKKKTYLFNEVVVCLENSNIVIKTKQFRYIKGISHYIEGSFDIYYNYIEYNKTNKIEEFNNTISYNNILNKFSIFGFILSILFITLSIAGYILKDNIIINIILLLFGLFILLLSIIGVLTYKNYKIIIKNDKILIYNLFNKQKEYNKKEIKIKETKILYKLYYNQKLITKSFKYVLDNDYILFIKD